MARAPKKQSRLTAQQRFHRRVVYATVFASMGLQAQDQYPLILDKVEQVFEYQATQTRREIARAQKTCNVRAFQTLHENAYFDNLQVTEVSDVGPRAIRRVDADKVPHDHVWLDLVLSLGEKGVRAIGMDTKPSIQSDAIVTANPVVKGQDGGLEYGGAYPAYREPGIFSNTTISNVHIYPPSDKRNDVPVAIRMNMVAEFPEETKGIHRSIGSVTCGYLVYREGMWRTIPVDGVGAPNIAPSTFMDTEFE